MPTLQITEDFNGLKNISRGFRPCLIVPTLHPLLLEQGEKFPSHRYQNCFLFHSCYTPDLGLSKVFGNHGWYKGRSLDRSDDSLQESGFFALRPSAKHQPLRHKMKNYKVGYVGITNCLSLLLLKPVQRQFQPHDEAESVVACGISIRMDNILHVWLDCESR